MFRAPVTYFVLTALVLAACGSDRTAQPATSLTTVPATAVAPATTAPPTTLPPTTTATVPATTTTTENSATQVTITVSNGEVTEGGGRHVVPLDSEVSLIVRADISDEVHLHGYDLFAPVEPARPANLSFTADIPGIFEVELESSHLLLAELEVS